LLAPFYNIRMQSHLAEEEGKMIPENYAVNKDSSAPVVF